MNDINQLECPFCNKKFTKRAFLSTHLNNYNLSIIDKEKLVLDICYGKQYIDSLVNDYILEKFSIYELPIDMSKYLSIIGVKRTSKEERATARYKEKYKASILERYGTDNISKIQFVKDKKKITELSKYDSYNDYVDDIKKRLKRGLDEYYFTDKHKDTIIKINNTIKEKYGVDNISKNIEIKHKIINSKKEYFSKLTHDEKLKITENARKSVTHRGGFSSKPEKKVQRIFISIGFNIECNKMLFQYSWDIVYHNFLIEIHGIYWHAKPSVYTADFMILNKIKASDIWEKDARKQKKAFDNGYTVIVIWEDEIKSKNDDEIKLFIKMRLAENEYYIL